MAFFKYARSKKGVKSAVGPLIDDNDVVTCDDQEMGQMLNAFFASGLPLNVWMSYLTVR